MLQHGQAMVYVARRGFATLAVLYTVVFMQHSSVCHDRAGRQHLASPHNSLAHVRTNKPLHAAHVSPASQRL